MAESIIDASVEVMTDLVTIMHEGDEAQMVTAGTMLATLTKGQLTVLALTITRALEREIQHSADVAGLSFEEYCEQRAAEVQRGGTAPGAPEL